MKILRGLLLAACLIIGSMPVGAANKHQKALNGTFVLYGRSAERGIDHFGLCTAFAYQKTDDGYNLMTAGHCFLDAPQDATYLVASGQITDTPELQPVEVVNHVDDGNMDVAELHLKTKKHYELLELDTTPTKIDDGVFYVGYPEMLTQVLYTGRIGSDPIQVAPSDGEGICDICKGRILMQNGGGPGASGSPVISERTGKVVGILEGHVFENGIVIVPAISIEGYYAKAGHSQAEIKNVQSEVSPL